MSSTGFITVKKFAELTRTTRDILHNFDKIGLFSPMRGENNYRYYSARQLSMLSVIRTLQGLGMSLAEIKELKDQRTPERAGEIFSLQIEKIDKKIDDWSRAKKLLMTFENSIHASLNIDEKAITVQNLPAEVIVLGDLNDYNEGMNDYDALFSFYKAIGDRYPNMNLNYPIWGIFSQERIKRRDWVWPDRYYFYNPEGHDKRPAGTYVVGYTRGGYGQSGNLYERLMDYIDKYNFEICGNAYEEYPLNEVYISDENNYLIRVMIHVCKLDEVSR